MALVEILTEQQRKKRVWKRLFNLLFAVTFIGVACYLYLIEQNYQVAKWHSWVNNTGQQYTAQYNSILAQAISNKDEPYITQILDNIAKHPAVIEVVLFSDDGQAMFNEQWLPGQHLLYNHRDSSPQIYIAELWHQNKLHGYLRVTLNRQTLVSNLMPVVQANYAPLLMVAILIFVLAFFLGRKFTLWRHNSR